jgi:hypothetical protein
MSKLLLLPEDVRLTAEDVDRCEQEHSDRPMFGCPTCFLFLAYSYASTAMTTGTPDMDWVAQRMALHGPPVVRKGSP